MAPNCDTYSTLLKRLGSAQAELDGLLPELFQASNGQVLVAAVTNLILCKANRRQNPWLAILISVGALAKVDLIWVLVREISPSQVENGIRRDECSVVKRRGLHRRTHNESWVEYAVIRS